MGILGLIVFSLEEEDRERRRLLFTNGLEKDAAIKIYIGKQQSMESLISDK